MERVVIVTGGSRGIGAATARLAAARGYAICVNHVRNREAADAVVADCRRARVKAIAVQADVAVEDDVVRLFVTVDRELGRVTALVNNAGIMERQTRLEEMYAERITRVLAANVVGSFLCCREAVRCMSTRRGGTGGAIVNVSSVAARVGAPGEYVDYAAAKGAIDSLTLGLSKEAAKAGIRVNAVRPGFIYTDIHASGGEPGRVDRVKQFVPMKRGGQPEEVASAILWLLSDEASYATARSSTWPAGGNDSSRHPHRRPRAAVRVAVVGNAPGQGRQAVRRTPVRERHAPGRGEERAGEVRDGLGIEDAAPALEAVEEPHGAYASGVSPLSPRSRRSARYSSGLRPHASWVRPPTLLELPARGRLGSEPSTRSTSQARPSSAKSCSFVWPPC